jgi:hypothetical protein
LGTSPYRELTRVIISHCEQYAKRHNLAGENNTYTVKQFVIPVKLELSDQNASLKNDGRIREIKKCQRICWHYELVLALAIGT